MNNTIAYTQLANDTGTRGSQCRPAQTASEVRGSLCLALCLMQRPSRWTSTSPRSLLAVMNGTLPSGSSIQTERWSPTDARLIGPYGSRLRRQLTLDVFAHTSSLKSNTPRSRGTAIQILSSTRGDSSMQSAEPSGSEVHGSTPGPRISCTLSSVGRAPDPHTLSGGYPEVGAFEASRVLRVANPCHQQSDGMGLQQGPVAQRSAPSSDGGGRSHLPGTIRYNKSTTTGSSTIRAVGRGVTQSREDAA